MESRSEIRNIAFVGDYLPRQCGIATFTTDLCTSVAAQFPKVKCFSVPVNDVAEGYDDPPEVSFEIDVTGAEVVQNARVLGKTSQ